MKALQIALIVAFLLPLGGNAMADARPAKKSATSSYKSGFSSQKSNSASKNNSTAATPGKNNASFGAFGSRQRDAAPAPASDSSAQPAKRGGFGAFGSSSGSQAAAPDGRGQSAMSKDLAQRQAQANALKTLDERRAAANAPAPLPPLDNRVPGVGQQQPGPPGSPNYGPQSPSQPYGQPPVVVQQRGGGNGMGAAILGFMLGNSMHSSANAGYYPANAVPGNPGAAAQQSQQQPASFGSSVLRTFAWLVLLGVIGWLVYFVVRRVKRGNTRSTANYSFERD